VTSLRTPAVAAPVDVRRWRALSVCLVALFATLLDVSVTNVALPAIGTATGAGPSQLQWVVSGYVLAFGLVPVIGGRLGDDRGRRTMFLVGVGGFTVTSALVGVAPHPGILVAARVLQGLFGGLINPQVSGLVQQLFRGAERGRAFGAIGAVVGTATAVGPVLGGALIGLGGEDWGWRLVFFVNIPVGVVAMVLGWRWLPRPPRPDAGPRRRLDVPGALLLGLTTFCVLFPTVQYDAVRDARLFWLLVPAVPLSIAFVVRERRLTRLRADPLVDLRLFRQPSYAVGVGLALLYFCGYTGLPLVLSLYLQLGRGLDALHAGLAVTSFAVGSAVSAPLAGRLVARAGRPLVVGALVLFGLGALAVGLVVRTDPDDVALRLALPLLVLGLGSGAIITPNQALSLQDVDPRMGGAAGGVLQTSQRIGSAIGQSVIGAVFFAALGGTPPTGSPAYSTAMATAVVVTLAFVVAALVLGVTDVVVTRRRARRP
jgi:EmrB/QacA subfamily drug resistance transporter